jgi:hypothetical protein
MSESKKVIIGNIGEEIIDFIYSRFGSKRTDDWYDAQKDGTIYVPWQGGKWLTQECKTMRLNNKTQEFWIEEKQFWKLDNVDVLFFIKVPESLEEGIHVYRCKDHKHFYRNFVFKDKKFRGYPIINCKEIAVTHEQFLVEEVFNNSKAISTNARFSNK